MKPSTFYVTTPIYYGTAKPHLGSLYSTLLADVAARWNKLKGKEVFFLTGTDEHGQKIAQAAEKAGKEPQVFVDSFIPAYKDAWKAYNIEYDHFIRTTDTHHIKAVQQWLQDLIDKGDIYKDFYKGWYCTPCETFVDTQDDAPPCPSCGRATQLVSEESYFFKLSKYQDRLLTFYEECPEFVIPRERLNEVISFVKGGLKDLSISRTTVKWGIPFPGDPKHVVYVWADALNNYITGVGYGDPSKKAMFEKWWPANLHVMAKDILRFHAVYWPAFLMASNLALPKHMLVHGWITVNKQKMSKSFGNVVDPMELQATYGVDPVRYYLVRQMAVTHDGDFSDTELEQKIETDLANDLGNLLNRTLSLSLRYDLEKVEAPDTWSPEAHELRNHANAMLLAYCEAMDGCLYHQALGHVWKFINQTNAFFHAQEPWKLVKNDKAAFADRIAATCHALKTIGVILLPVMPDKMMVLLDALGYSIIIQPGIDNIEQMAGAWCHVFTLKKIPTLFEKSGIAHGD
ncbi:methionine--tRNA ligase [Candidatus Babeliales bacterium]|nr:methionine--tRNA ligase [Candidatus Babeliales bacterium]